MKSSDPTPDASMSAPAKKLQIREHWQSKQSDSSVKIPRIFHFITGLDANFGGMPFSFVHYMAIRSALEVNKGFRSRVYYHYEPTGRYWDAIKGDVELIRVDLPTQVFGNPIQLYSHKADVLRMRILLEQGGIYLDLDTICQRPFEPLLDGRVVMGLEELSALDGTRHVVGLCNATIIAPPNAEFLHKWYETYHDFNGDSWNRFSVQIPLELAREHPALLRVEPASSFFWPTWDVGGIASMFVMDCEFPDAYSFHLWESKSWRFPKDLDVHAVLTIDTTYNKLARRFIEKGPSGAGTETKPQSSGADRQQEEPVGGIARFGFAAGAIQKLVETCHESCWELHAEIGRLTNLLASARAEAAEQEACARRALAETAVTKENDIMLRSELEAVYDSSSWRMTKPLRSIGARYPGLNRWTRWRPGRPGRGLN